MALRTGFTGRIKGKEVFAPETVTICGATGSANLGAAVIRGGGKIVGAQYLNATGVGNGADTTEDTLYTYSLPANSFDAVAADMVNYRSLYLYAWGLFANNAHSKHARLYFGSSIVVDSGANTTTGGIAWALEAVIFHVSSAVQIGSGQSITGTTHGGCVDLNGTETETAAIVIKVTGQTGTSGASDIVLKGLMIQFLN